MTVLALGLGFFGGILVLVVDGCCGILVSRWLRLIGAWISVLAAVARVTGPGLLSTSPDIISLRDTVSG